MKKKIILVTAIIIAIVSFIFVYRYYNHEDKATSLTVAEKRWVQENKSTAIDIEVINDYPIYGMEGEGIFFDFLKDLKKDIGLELNKVPYLKTSTPTTTGMKFQILDDNTKVSKDDLLLFEDYYIAVGTTYQRINRVSDIKNVTFGIFDADKDIVSYYLKSATNVSYKTYTTIDEIYAALDKGEVGMIIVPNMMYLDKIIGSKYVINYYFTEITKKVVLSLPNSNEDLKNIVTKYYNKWYITKFVKEYDKEYYNYYLTMNKLTSKDKADLSSKVYTYGYVENNPYEVKLHGKLAGIAGEYVNRISRFGNIDFKYKKYPNKNALETAIRNKEIDMYFDYYGISDDNYQATLSTFIEDYVVLAKDDSNYIINSYESLKNKEIAMISDNSLYNYVSSNLKADIKTYDSVDKLAEEAGNRLVVLDKNVYDRYQKSKFRNYIVLYLDTMMNDYKFMIKDNNDAFYNLVNYTINTNSYYNYKNSGLDSLKETYLESSNLQQVYMIVLAVIFTPIIVLFIIIALIKKKKAKKKVKITNRHKYTDMLTSLKNRNYLNAKMPEWEASKVYPQAIVMIDLNNVKYVNDNYGHEEGDKLIIEAAGILVNTQLENSEIMRTDGNEFLIYLVGYSERQVSTYTKKLSKEMKNLPHEFGAGVGFSMILDEIKTLDDAINEATLEMIANKEDYK